jgi:predicted Zn-dependent peptidase
MEFRYETIDNGLTVAAELNPTARSAAVGFFVKTGSRDETPEVSGVSHFLEHMMFKGTDKLTALEVNEYFDKLGANYNAFTSEENTVYYAAVLPEMLEDVTDLWTRLMRPSLRDDDFNMEKNVIKEEIAMYRDLPQFDVLDRCRSAHFNSHPCGNSVLGTVESIDGLAAERMRNYFQRRYAPDNMVLAMCGQVDFDKICSLAQEKCGKWNKSEAARKTEYFSGSMDQHRQERENLSGEHICLISPATSAQDEKRFAMSLLSVIIGDSTGSRYYWSLIDTALADIAVMQYESMDGVGAMYSYIRCAKENTKKVNEKIREVLDEVNKSGITADELEKAKNKVLSTVTIKCETPMGRLVNLGFNWIYLKEYRSVNDDVESIRAVTVEEINALVEKYPPNKFTSYAIGPKS